MAQVTVEALIGSSVDTVDDRYRPVADGIALFQRGSGPAALKMFRDAKAQRPELPPGEVLFAHLCFASNNVKPGRDALQAAAVTFKDDPEVWNMLADLQLREGHLAEADVLFRKAISVADAYKGNSKRQPQLLASALAGAALTNERRGQWGEAEPFLQRWLTLDADNADIPSRLAIVLINTQRFDEAKKTLEQLRQLNPKQLPAPIVLGVAYERLGKSDQAKESMLEGLAKFPNEFPVQIAVASWALTSGDTDLALKCSAAAAELDPESPIPHVLIAQADYRRGDFAQAEARFQKIYQLKPGNYDAVNGLALSMLAQKDESKYPLAMEYAEILAKNNNDLRTVQGRQAATLLAWALHRNRRSGDAERLITGVLNSGPISPATAYFSAEILASQGKKEAALDILNKALAETTAFPYFVQAEALKKKLEAP
ncbi:MAG TPA: tetratricopeptide repeat protein [Planctomicrobium sp.]|nr:tetratricopeptide repeat protein [Planctomicrobium sp.]